MPGFGLDNGMWHTVHIVRHGRWVRLEIDGISQRTETLMSATPILKRGRYQMKIIKLQTTWCGAMLKVCGDGTGCEYASEGVREEVRI